MLTGLTLTNQNFTKAMLILLAICSFCGCEAKKRDVKIGETAPVFTAMDITGESVSLNLFNGMPVVIYFWKNSCCGDSLKLVEPLYRAKWHNELAIIAVNVGDPKEVVASYAKNNGITFTMLTDEPAAIFRQYQAFGFPTIFIIDKNGIIRKKILGNIQVNQLAELVQRQFDIQKQAEAAYEKNRLRQ